MSDTYCICIRVEDSCAENVSTCPLRRAIACTMERHQVPPDTGVSLLITDDEAVRNLNRRFRGIDEPTDVLSFPAGEDDFPGVAEEDPYLGDIIIAYPYTAACAAEDGHPLEHVLMLLAVHGTLHLLGFDHDTAENQVAMWGAQKEILHKLGVPTDVIPPLHDFSEGESA